MFLRYDRIKAMFQATQFGVSQRPLPTRRGFAFIALALLLAANQILAGITELAGPAGSRAFGTEVVVLPNGNIVVTDPEFDLPGPISNVGAVYLYTPDGELISTLTGSSAGDQVGFRTSTKPAIFVLTNGNYVVRSTKWASSAGAVTWGSAISGVSGVLSAGNSLVGSNANDQIGLNVILLSNGHYLQQTRFWDNGSAVSAGVVSWGDGNGGSFGVVSASNSLVGTNTNDRVGGDDGVLLLSNGNYVVLSPNWSDGGIGDRGAATWADGSVGAIGAVSTGNSLIGGSSGDQVGTTGVSLSNGNYVIGSRFWDDLGTSNVGAATWADGSVGLVATVGPLNSLIGSSAGDEVGLEIDTSSNGNYLVRSPGWHNAGVVDAGAATLGNGNGGTVGAVSAGNSLVGSSTGDRVGGFPSTTLGNGNLVLHTTFWDNAGITDVGAVTWINGQTGIAGPISATNSLIGSQSGDQVGQVRSIALANGNYVAISSRWQNGTQADAGAVTWGDGSTGVVGIVSMSNSLVGSSAGDGFSTAVFPLANGHYVVATPRWDNGASVDVGAVTWGNGSSGVNGPISTANSMVGLSSGDRIGANLEAGVLALSNGNYVIRSESWDDGAMADVGALTWVDGSAASSGTVNAGNSLIGATAGDELGGNNYVIALNNGNYVVACFFCSVAGTSNAGAVVWADGNGSSSGVLSAANALVGSVANDLVGASGLIALADGNYLAYSGLWNSGAVSAAGAVTLGHGAAGTVGEIDPSTSVVGESPFGGEDFSIAEDPNLPQLVVGRPADNEVSLLRYGDPVFADGYE